MPTQDELARQLIDTVREAAASEAVLLQRRITATLNYLEDVATPNAITLQHARAFLSGERDDILESWIHYTSEKER